MCSFEGSDCARGDGEGTGRAFGGAIESAFMVGGVDEGEFELKGERLGAGFERGVLKLL